MPKIGNLYTTITADAGSFQTNFKRAEKSVEQFNASTATAGRATREFSRTSGRGARGALELSRGVEDAAVSFGTGGFAGAIRGASNNVSQFAAQMSPAAGAITGLLVAGLSVGVSAFERLSKQSKQTAKDLQEFSRKRLDLRLRENKEQRDFNEKNAQDVGRLDLKSIQKRLKEARGDVAAELKNQSSIDAEAQALAANVADKFNRNQLYNLSLQDVRRRARAGEKGALNTQSVEAGRKIVNERRFSVADIGNVLARDKKSGEAEAFAEALTNIDKKRLESIGNLRGARGRVTDLLGKESDVRKGLQAQAADRLKSGAFQFRSQAGLLGLKAFTAAQSFDLKGYLGFTGSGGKDKKRFTEAQELSKRLEANSIRRSLLGSTRASKVGTNTAAVGARGAFQGAATASRELAKVNEENRLQAELRRLDEERNRLLKDKLGSIEKSLGTLGVAGNP